MGLFDSLLPEKIELMYKVNADGSMVLRVEPSGNVFFMWEYCPAGTADWQYIAAGLRPMYGEEIVLGAGTAFRIGNKFRCVGSVGKRVVCYSSVLTVSEKTARKAAEEQHSGRQNSDYGNRESSYYSRSHSGEDRRQSAASAFVKDYFEGCESWEQISQRYRQLMKDNHPDRGGSESAAKEINEQYTALKKMHGR